MIPMATTGLRPTMRQLQKNELSHGHDESDIVDQPNSVGIKLSF